MCAKVQVLWNLGDLKTPRWSGEQRIHLVSKMWGDSFAGSGVAGRLSYQLFRLCVGVGELKGACQGAPRLSLGKKRGKEEELY